MLIQGHQTKAGVNTRVPVQVNPPLNVKADLTEIGYADD